MTCHTSVRYKRPKVRLNPFPKWVTVGGVRISDVGLCSRPEQPLQQMLSSCWSRSPRSIHCLLNEQTGRAGGRNLVHSCHPQKRPGRLDWSWRGGYSIRLGMSLTSFDPHLYPPLPDVFVFVIRKADASEEGPCVFTLVWSRLTSVSAYFHNSYKYVMSDVALFFMYGQPVCI